MVAVAVVFSMLQLPRSSHVPTHWSKVCVVFGGTWFASSCGSAGSGRQPVWATLSPRRARVAFVMPSALSLLPAACDDASALWHVLAVSAQSFSLYFIAAYRLLASRLK